MPARRLRLRFAFALSATAIAFVAALGSAEWSGAQGGCSTSAKTCQAPGASTPGPSAVVGSRPPDTTGKNLTGSGTLSLATLLDKPTAVVFWLNSCPHCQKALPAINRLASGLEGSQVVTAAIDAGIKGPKGFETPAAAVKTLRLRLPTILVANKVAQDDWHVTTTPIAYVIDSAGVITQVLQPKSTQTFAGDIKRALVKTS